MTYDIAIVGAGIVGLATARALQERSPGVRLVVLEKEREIARHQTGHNSGVIHSGIYYKPGSYKARLCVEGVRLMKDFCEKHGIAVETCGKVIVATSEEEVPRLRTLHERGVANGVPGIALIDVDRLRELEPHARAVAAIHSPQTAIVDYGQVSQAFARDLEAQGAALERGFQVASITRAGYTTHRRATRVAGRQVTESCSRTLIGSSSSAGMTTRACDCLRLTEECFRKMPSESCTQ